MTNVTEFSESAVYHRIQGAFFYTPGIFHSVARSVLFNIEHINWYNIKAAGHILASPFIPASTR